MLFASDRVQLSFAADSGWKGRAGLNINSITFFVAIIIPVLEIDQREQRARRTKDIWEDQKAGRPKNLIAEEA